MILFAGYNGFQQFTSLCSNAKYLLEDDYITKFVSSNVDYEQSVISVSWSNVLVCSRDGLIVSGFVNGEPSGSPRNLIAPFKESVIQASCSNDLCIVVLNSGHVWQYNINLKEWTDLMHLFSSEIFEKDQGKIVKVCCGNTLKVALSDTGIVYCIPNIIDYDGVIKDVVCGKEHGVVLTENGSVLTWGGGSRGQLGIGELEDSELLCEVEALSGLRVVAISAGGWHSAAVTEEGDLYTWGWNKQGQLGFPTPEEDKEFGVSVLALPKPVEMADDVIIELVSCGASHTVIKTSAGDVMGCGWNKWGQLGIEPERFQRMTKMTSLPIPAESSIRQIICGPWSTLLICK